MTLEVKGLVAKVRDTDKVVVNGVSLRVDRGEIVALMGPNGSGKSSLAYTLMGHPRYEVVSGDILLDGESIVGLPPEERSLRGLFLGFQNPVEVEGVKLSSLIVASYNKRVGERDLFKTSNPRVFIEMNKYASMLGLRSELLYRDVNVGFSGGERKRSEMLQALMLNPRYVILDEPDSGLDVDGVKVIANSIELLRSRGTGVLLITHYTRILRYVKPSRVYVMVNGRIVASGGYELAEKIDREGYGMYV